MKRILLVSPRRGSDFASNDIPRPAHAEGLPRALMPPLDLATIKALTPQGFEVDIWDESVQPHIDEQTDLGKDYDAIGVTGYMTHLPWAIRLAEVARKKGLLSAIGGPGVSGSPDKCRGVFDVVFIGEAELTWPQFLEDWTAGRHRSEYRQVQRPDVASSPAPNWEGFSSMSKDYLMGAVQTTRGCPFDCEFCDVIHLFGRQPRHKPVETILQEVAALEKRGMRMIFFCDDNFIGRPKYAKDLLKALIPLNNSFERPMGFTTQLTVNVAEDDELLELLADANFHWVLIGIESPREASLREANKPQNYKTNLVDSLRRIQSYGVLIKGNMIVGFDHDDERIFDETYAFLLKSGVVNVGVSMLHAYPGTPLLARLQKAGRVVDLGDDFITDVMRPLTNIVPLQMSRVELFRGYKSLMQRLRSWDFFDQCAKDILGNLRRPPNVPRKAPPDPARLELLRRAIDTLDEKGKSVVTGVLQAVWQRAPMMMERMVSTLFRFGGNVAAFPRIASWLDARIEVESSPDFVPQILRTPPPIPPGFKTLVHKEAFPKTYDWLLAGLADRRLVAEGLLQVWKSFVIRWGATDFTGFEDYHLEHLRELCTRTIELGNSGQLGAARVNAEVDGLSGVQLRRLAGEILVSVEQDLRGVSEASVVPLVVNVHSHGDAFAQSYRERMTG